MASIAPQKKALVRSVSRTAIYYRSKLDAKDNALRRDIERVLSTRAGRGYGHRKIAIALGFNKKRVLRVMQKFGIRPYRRRGRKWRKAKTQDQVYPNLLQLITPAYEGCVWAADFTHLDYRGKDIAVATVIDLFTRQIVGVAVSTKHDVRLIIEAFGNALLSHGRPARNCPGPC